MNKKLITTKTIVATAIGAALFAIAFMFIKIPSPVPETQIQSAYAISALFGVLFGPFAGGLIAFVGHAVNDIALYGSAWWSWVIASGVAGTITGLAFYKLNVDEGEADTKALITFNVFQVVGHAVAWLVVAPVLDILIYAEPVNKVFVQGAFAFASNAITTGVLGTILIVAYAATRVKKGSLTKK